jgi:parallel beta-helix repeat protein
LKGKIKQVTVYQNNVFIIKSGNPDVILQSPLPQNNEGHSWTEITTDTLGIRDIHAFSIIPASEFVYNLYCATDVGVLVYNSCPSCVTSAGTPIPPSQNPSSHNVVIHTGEEVHFTEDVFVPEGTSFIVEEGATVLFDEGTQMRVEGSLLVQGTFASRAHFLSPYEGVKWKGIHAMFGSSISMEYAEIADATIGILSTKADVELSSVLIQNCRIGAGIYSAGEEKPMLNKCSILNNNWGIVLLNQADALLDSNNISGGQKGLFIDASFPLLYGNTIENNTQVGVVVYGGGYPRFGDIAASANGYNIVQGNALAQLLTVQGYAFLGYLQRDCITELGGGNIIAGTDPNAPLCVALEKSAITSMATNWGLANVSAEDFIRDEQSSIVYHCLSQEPVNSEEELLWQALEHRSIGNFPLAKEEYLTIIQQGTEEQALQALAELT